MNRTWRETNDLMTLNSVGNKSRLIVNDEKRQCSRWLSSTNKHCNRYNARVCSCFEWSFLCSVANCRWQAGTRDGPSPSKADERWVIGSVGCCWADVVNRGCHQGEREGAHAATLIADSRASFLSRMFKHRYTTQHWVKKNGGKFTDEVRARVRVVYVVVLACVVYGTIVMRAHRNTVGDWKSRKWVSEDWSPKEGGRKRATSWNRYHRWINARKYSVAAGKSFCTKNDTGLTGTMHYDIFRSITRLQTVELHSILCKHQFRILQYIIFVYTN